MVLAITFMYVCALVLLIPYLGALWLAFGGDRMRAEQERSAHPTPRAAAIAPVHDDLPRDARVARIA